MELVSKEQLQEWLRLDPDNDLATLEMLASSAVDVIEHETGLRLRSFSDPITHETVQPFVPVSLKHAIAVFVSGHFNERDGSTDAAILTVKRLCAPFRVPRL